LKSEKEKRDETSRRSRREGRRDEFNFSLGCTEKGPFSSPTGKAEELQRKCRRLRKARSNVRAEDEGCGEGHR